MAGMEPQRFENRPSVDKGSIGPGDLKITDPDEIESKWVKSNLSNLI